MGSKHAEGSRRAHESIENSEDKEGLVGRVLVAASQEGLGLGTSPVNTGEF